jgi:hypothetical protein
MHVVTSVLRGLVASAVVLAATAFIIGFFPGIEVYHDDAFIKTRAVVEQWNWFLGALVILLAPGVAVWMRPRMSYALLWSMWSIAVAMIMFVATFDLNDFAVRNVPLWPAEVFGVLMFALLFLLIAVVPVACGVLWWITREKPLRVELPIARVVTAPRR